MRFVVVLSSFAGLSMVLQGAFCDVQWFRALHDALVIYGFVRMFFFFVVVQAFLRLPKIFRFSLIRLRCFHFTKTHTKHVHNQAFSVKLLQLVHMQLQAN